MKRTVSAVALAAMVLLAPLAMADTATAAPLYPNCDAAYAVGVSNIHRGEPGYRPALDHDHDGVACEEPAGGSSGAGSSGSHPSSGTHEGTSTSSGSSGTSGSSSTAGSSGSSTAQVAVVPEGGAETGDGSTEGHSGWWVGGALLAGFAAVGGLVTGRRTRVGVRR